MSGVIIIPSDYAVTNLGIGVIPSCYRMQVHQGEFGFLSRYDGLYDDVLVIGTEKDRAALAALQGNQKMPEYTFFEGSQKQAISAHITAYATQAANLLRR